MKKTAIAMVTKDRWNMTYQTLMSLYYSDQPKSEYDLFILDNGSSPENVEQLKEFVNSGLVPVTNAYFMGEKRISVAYNMLLAMTKDYDFRLKLDNDIVMFKTVTPPAKGSETSSHIPESHPGEVDPLSGAPRSGAIIGGVNSPTSRLQSPSVGIQSRGKKSFVADNSSRFLDHLTSFAEDNAVDLTALVPVPPTMAFPSAFNDAINRTLDGRPYLQGACMLISKKAFEMLGYFDERLDKRIDVEYSQRAIKNGINIGYHPSYWSIHIGAREQTEANPVRDQKYAMATSIMQNQPIPIYSNSSWEKVLRQIKKASHKHQIVNVE